jgi:hypothetical protein
MGMYELDKIIQYFDEKISTIEEERIKQLYNFISNPHVRVNSSDKQWVAYDSQPSEDKTVLKAICEILDYGTFRCQIKEDDIVNAINNTGELFDGLGIRMKPRIPFYILVLNELVA